jgi:hypothetical protein
MPWVFRAPDPDPDPEPEPEPEPPCRCRGISRGGQALPGSAGHAPARGGTNRDIARRRIPDLFPFSVAVTTETGNEWPGRAHEPGIPGKAGARGAPAPEPPREQADLPVMFT